jgi:hypothetical protein
MTIDDPGLREHCERIEEQLQAALERLSDLASSPRLVTTAAEVEALEREVGQVTDRAAGLVVGRILQQSVITPEAQQERRLELDEGKVVLVVDFYHAVEHLARLAAMRKKWTAAERGRWVRRQRRLLLEGKIDVVIAAIDELCRGRASKAMAKERDYFVRHREAMDYGAVRANNLPIGSGAVESAIRRVVNLRIKGPGIFWHREHAEAMLMLRAFQKAGRWNALKQTASSQALPVAA